MQLEINGKQFNVDFMSMGLNIIGFLALIASIQGELGYGVIALLIFIFDHIRHPYPVIINLEELEDDDNNPSPG